MGQTLIYDRSRFDVGSVSEAKAIILTPDDSTTDERWAKETPYLGELITAHLDMTKSPRVLDYGCGIGRMAKELLSRHTCSVVGVDTSMNMRALAPTYVRDDNFISCAPSALDAIAPVHYALSIWALQHIPDVKAAIAAIGNKLRNCGSLFVVNSHQRFIPTEGGCWVDDGLDVRELLGVRFKETAFGLLDPWRTTPLTAQHAYWGIYQRRE